MGGGTKMSGFLHGMEHNGLNLFSSLELLRQRTCPDVNMFDTLTASIEPQAQG